MPVASMLRIAKSLKRDSRDLLIPIFALAPAKDRRFNNVEWSGIAPISSMAPQMPWARQISLKPIENGWMHDFFGLLTSSRHARKHFASAP